jgi:hypothetical protein
MKRIFMAAAVLALGFLTVGLTGCFTFGVPQTSPPSQRTAASTPQPQAQPQQKGESQWEKLLRLVVADGENGLLVATKLKTDAEKDNRTLTAEETWDAYFQPQIISGIGEITTEKLSDPGRPYYFKLRAIYKGYDADAKEVRLQDLGQKQSSVMDSALGTAFGIDTDVYSVMSQQFAITEFPTEANAVATFYLYAVHLTEDENGKQTSPFNVICIMMVLNIEPPLFDPAKFIVAGGMHYITVEDAHSPTQRELMSAFFLGGALGNSTSNVFDPVVYPLVDLMDARTAMDTKDIRNDYTFPTVSVKYVSEVIFKGQSNTTITVSTDDNVLTERMNFTGRASTVKTGDRIRVYYTIAKDPLEKWQIQAIERL